MDADVVIIGAGLGGLSAAVNLAQRGHRVAVFEAHSVPGGYAHEFRRGHFRFDVSLHHIGGLGPDGTIGRLLRSYGAIDGLSIKRRETLFRIKTPTLELELPNEPRALMDLLVENFPSEREGLRGVFAELAARKIDIVEPWMPDSESSGPEGPVPDEPLLDVFRRHLKDERLITVLGEQLWMYLGLPPSRVNASFSTCVFASSFVEGSYYIDGGGTALTRALVKRLEELGGTCKMKRPVKTIITEDGVATGVILKNGERINAPVVISNADPYQTFFELVGRENVSRVYAYRVEQMVASTSSYALYLGLDCPPEEIGFRDENLFVTYGDDLDAAHQRMLDHDLERTDWGLTNNTLLDPACTPAGKGVLAFFELTPSRDWTSLDPEAYAAEKARVQEALLTKYEAHFPGLRSHIQIIELGTPRTNWRYSHNAGGAIYGLEQSVAQSGRKRLRNTTPIKGLYLVGAWTWAGGGYEGAMMSGVQTATAVVSQIGGDVPERHMPEKTKPHIGGASGDEIRQNAREQTRPTINPTELAAAHTFTFDMRVYLEDTDALGMTFHASYVRFLDRARTEAFLEERMQAGDLDDRYRFNVYRIDITYMKASKVGEMLRITTQFAPVSKLRFKVYHEIRSHDDNRLLVKALTEVIIVGPDGKLREIPQEFLDRARSREP